MIGMIISTIVVSLTGGGSSGGAASLPKDKNKLVEWVKDKLKRLYDALKRLAGKAVGALLGILGLSLEQFLTFWLKLLVLEQLIFWAFLVYVVGAVIA